MKHLLLLTALLSTQFITLQAQSTTDERAMQIFAQELMAAYNRQDISALRAMYTRDVVGDSLYHRDHVAETFMDVFTRQQVTLFVRHIGVTWSDAEHALVATGTYEGHGVKIPYGDSLNWKVAYRNTMVQDSGRWLSSGVAKIDVQAAEVWGTADLLAEVGETIYSAKDGAQLGKDKYITVWKKEDGQWKIFRDCSNSDLPLPAMPSK